MDRKEAQIKYLRQQLGAFQRGIEWRFTFESWLEFWGDDLDRRGVGSSKLCMQRIWDKGPYHPDNCIKGHQRQNVRTWQNVKLAKRAEARAKAHQKALDALGVSLADPDTMTEDEEELSALGPRLSEIYEVAP